MVRGRGVSNSVDITRHFKIFDPRHFPNLDIHVIGCGATGSKIAIELAKLGVQRLHLWDFDSVEQHNIANQHYVVTDIGKPKVEALAAHITASTGLVPSVHNERVTGRTQLDGAVFLLTDTMSSRKEIFEGAIKYRFGVKLMIETRMSAKGGRIYTVEPTDPDQISFWEGRWYPDEDAGESLCGSSTTVGATASMVSAYAVWAFIDYCSYMRTAKDKPYAELLFSVSPPAAIVPTKPNKR